MAAKTLSSLSYLAGARKRVWNIANLPALLAAMVVCIAFLAVERINNQIHIQQARNELQVRTNLMGSKLQGLISGNIELGRGLANVISVESYMTKTRFSLLASRFLEGHSQLISVTASPTYKDPFVFPEQSEVVLEGLNFWPNSEQMAQHAMPNKFGGSRLLGPIKLPNGTPALVARYFIQSEELFFEARHWGTLSAVIDLEAVYRESGLLDESPIEFALIGANGLGRDGPQFFGSSHIASTDPVSVTVDLGAGQWVLLAIPKGGWDLQPPNFWTIRVMALGALLLVVIPFLIVGWMSKARVAYLDAIIRNQKEMVVLSKRLELALETSGIGIWEYDLKTRDSKWDPRHNEMYGFPKDKKVTNAEWESRLHPDDRARVVTAIDHAIASGELYRCEFRICLPDGSERTTRAVGTHLVTPEGEHRVIGVSWDITEDVLRQKALKEARAESERRNTALELAYTRIKTSALHDFLTGLPNSRHLEKILANSEKEFGLPPKDICLIKLDLDGFKETNDAFGHAIGDEMLMNTADILRDITRPGEFIARMGGDEFVVLCKSETDEKRASQISANILHRMHKPFRANGRVCRLGASIGIASGSESGNDLDKLRSNADLALNRSKQSGKGRYSFFNSSLAEDERQRRHLAEDLLRGIENKEFVAFYQGQYCARTHQLIGAEALARWMHPEKGLLPPAVFIDLAESLGVTASIDTMVLQHAIEAKQVMTERGCNFDRISVNVSAKHLGDKYLIESLQALDFDPESLTFELVESTYLDRSDPQVAANIRQIRDMGIDIEIDDFGTAYASIVSLTNLLPNRLKIDRELIMPIIESEDQRELVHAIIHIGRTLGIGIVAEGVESLTHADILKVMGVDVLQGYAFSRPMALDDFTKHHESNNDDEQVA